MFLSIAFAFQKMKLKNGLTSCQSVSSCLNGVISCATCVFRIILEL